MEQKKREIGPLFVLMSAVLMSTGGLLIKVIPWSPIAINAGRNLFAALVTYAYLKAIGHKIRINRTVLGCAACVCICCYAYTMAVRMTTAANAVVLQYTSPVFILLYLAIFFRQKPQRLDLLACAVVFAGMLFFFVESLTGGGMMGNVLALVSAATYAVVFMVNMFEGADSFSSYFWAQIMGAIIGLPWVILEPNQSAGSWLAVALMGTFQISVAYVLMARGLASTSPVTANLLCMTEPILNPILVAVFYGETIGGLAIVGIVIVMAGLFFYNLLSGRKTG